MATDKRHSNRGRVSPGLRSRPSLSDGHVNGIEPTRRGVAGTTVPAFVERLQGLRDRLTGRRRCRRDYGPGLR